MKVRKKPIIVEAHQWLKNGDHPEDKSELIDANGHTFLSEGDVVRRFNHPVIGGDTYCDYCNNQIKYHGWIDTLEGAGTVCPGDYVIKGVRGEFYAIKEDIFNETYDVVDDGAVCADQLSLL